MSAAAACTSSAHEMRCAGIHLPDLLLRERKRPEGEFFGGSCFSRSSVDDNSGGALGTIRFHCFRQRRGQKPNRLTYHGEEPRGLIPREGSPSISHNAGSLKSSKHIKYHYMSREPLKESGSWRIGNANHWLISAAANPGMASVAHRLAG